MEGGPDQVSLTGEDDSILVPRQRRAIAPGPQDRGCSDEDAMERLLHALDLEVRLERLSLSPERVPVDGHVHEAEQPRLRLVGLDPCVLREEDAARAGSHDWHGLVRRAPDDLVEEAELDEELGDRRALPAGDRQRIDAVQVLAASYADRVSGLPSLVHRPSDRIDVLAHVALDTDHADPHQST